MEKYEVAEMLTKITFLYPMAKKNIMSEMDEMTETWHEYLKNISYEQAIKNLDYHVTTRHQAPTIADILRVVETSGRAIPGYEETRKMLDEWKDKVPASKEAREKGLAEMRVALFGEDRRDG